MSNGHVGKLVLQEVPSGEVEKRIVMLLLKFAKKASPAELIEKVRNTPYVLSNNIPAEKALVILEALQKHGATAAFVPHAFQQPSAEQIRPIEPEPRFTFNQAAGSEEKTVHIPPIPKKNSARRLVTFLVTILLLLSLGYLGWQLWPVLGDYVREVVVYLKQLL